MTMERRRSSSMICDLCWRQIRSAKTQYPTRLAAPLGRQAEHLAVKRADPFEI